MTRWGSRCWPTILVAVLTGCGASNDATRDFDLLDSTQPQYGKTYAEWATEWISYSYRIAPPQCESPFDDETGQYCQLYQDAESPVFFLVGVFGGVAHRKACQIPKGKALFFPVFNVWADNTGLSAENLRPESDLSNYISGAFARMDPSKFQVIVDGEPITGLERGAVPPTRYVATLPPGQNLLECLGLPGLEGDYPGYVAGYWALLPPFESGEHRIEFGGTVVSEITTLNSSTVDVEYTFSL